MAEGRPAKVLSCASCRQRKIKCDKVQPICTQCSRVTLECVYPSRKPTRRVPRPRQSELLERISRLESIVGQADPGKLHELDSQTSQKNPSGLLPDCPPQRPGGGPRAGIGPWEGRSTPSAGTPTDTATRYLSHEFWDNLCEEVEGIKQALDQPSDEEDDDDGDQDQDSPESHDTEFQSLGKLSGFVFGNPTYHDRSQLSHPSSDMILRLWAIYVRNVDPLVKILHRPSLENDIHVFIRSGVQHQSPPSHDALLFCVYFAAISTLSEEEAQKQLGEGQQVLARRYRIDAERALAAADYLNVNCLVALQAFTLYVTVLRCSSIGRASWALTSTVVRLGQAMNLHRDGDGRRFPPFEAEMRRRLWYFIAVLDIRAAEDRGSDAILAPTSYNTSRPTNIDDDDFGPGSTVPLIPKATPAENVICMCTARCLVFGYITHPPTHSDPQSRLHTEDELIQHVRGLEHDFIHVADSSHLSSRYASEVARLVILKLWLIVQYPFSAQPSVAPMPVSRETMLRTAVSVMELSDRMTDRPWKNRFDWWTRCYVQWHPLAVALAELCIQTKGELADYAWMVVDRVFPLWSNTVADSARGPLWRPVRKLYKKAKEARADSMMRDLTINDSQQLSTAAQHQPHGSPDILGASRPVSEDGILFGVPGAIYTEPFDSMSMDPSSLFQYPTELTNVNFDQPLDSNISFDMAPWREFLNDTQIDHSPDSAGDS
ncbi:hypothetical protein ACO1O0_003395 [Amphichorda felina]